MTGSDVTKGGLRNVHPGREAITGAASQAPDGSPASRRGRRRSGGEQPMVPEARFDSYYGKPVINPPVWNEPDIPGYLFLGGMAGAASVLAAGAQLTRRRGLARASKLGAVVGAGMSAAALVHDLGRPERFLNMLRVFKPSSPMSVGSWLLAAYGPATGLAALSDITGRARWLGGSATAAAALLGPAVASYTGVLLSDTAVPAWHEGYREMPFVFVGSGAQAAAGLALIASPLRDNAPARRLALLGAAGEIVASQRMERRMGMVGEPYHRGRPGKLVRGGQLLAALGALGAVTAGRRSRLAAMTCGAALLAASACTRFGVFEAGMESARDPKYTVVPQRNRLGAPAPAPQGASA
ncbi:MAG: NrfD/PsrC family molybdoenzyme membrane anchor subunit [Acidimicrobiales bacterium]